MKVTILGCGPAGLMAAHGALETALDVADVDIISKARKSWMFGAQYLHEPIPGVPCGDPVTVSYRLQGDSRDYGRKVYGSMWDGSVSPEDLSAEHPAWDIRAAYNWLWDRYGFLIHDAVITPDIVSSLVESSDLVISTIPKDRLCVRGHVFGSADVWAAGDAPEQGIRIPYTCPRNTVLCNGEPSPRWYRLSNIYGYQTVEWPMSDDSPPISGAALVRKPTFNQCDCWPTIIHAGRYGRWEKGVLSHTAYWDARQAVTNLLEGK